MSTKHIIFSVLTSMSFGVCAVAQEPAQEEFQEVFGIARPAEPADFPTTPEQWKQITDKIENDMVDTSVFAAMQSEHWPKNYDKNKILNDFLTQNDIFSITSFVYNDPKTTPNSTLTSASPDELNVIWLKMLAEMKREQRKTEEKTSQAKD